MAFLVETGGYPSGIYQIETTDPVVGGVPDEATKAGLSNIPAMQLAKRTAWLRTQVDLLSTAVSGVITEEDVDGLIAAAVANLVGGAPGALDTLNELAAALGDNSNYAASVTSALAGKVSTSDISSNPNFSADTAKVPTRAAVKALVGWSYVSAQTSVPAVNSAITFAHGLGAKPSRWEVGLICITAQDGYAVGDEIPLSAIDRMGTSEYAAIAAVNATSIHVAGSNTGSYRVFPRTGGATVLLTTANWRLIARASL